MARELLASVWLAADNGLFIAYAMPGEKRNPFDLSAQVLDTGPRSGFIQTSRIVCAVHTHNDGQPVLIRFTTPLYRIYEKGQGWARPLRNGLVMEIEAERASQGWALKDRKSSDAILEPTEPVRRPTNEELPAAAPWPEPLPGCARRTRWNGVACVSRKSR